MADRRRRSPQRLLGWVVAVIVVLTAGITLVFSPTAQGQVTGLQVTGLSSGSAPSLGLDVPVVPVISARVVTEPPNGATGVSPIAPVRVVVSAGVLDKVSLTSSEGKMVAGQLAPDKTS